MDVCRKLASYEVYWRDLYSFLEAHGYTLRPRYHPDWEPSWKSTDPCAVLIEDSIGLPLYALGNRLIDATRVSDGMLVFIKKVPSSSAELDICRYLSSAELRQDPSNHCVPLLDILVHPSDPEVSFMVMPFLRNIDEPPFETVEDVFVFGEQILEGLSFMHEHNVAHRDCAFRNIMMDATAMYPQGFHPVFKLYLPDVSTGAPHLPRSAVGVTYYFTDFGISTHFSPGDSSRLVLGLNGLEKTVPELSDTVPYDPFKVDIFIMGALFRQKLLQVFSNVEMIAPLVASMTAPDPAARPDAAEALSAWRDIRAQTSVRQRRWRAKPRSESFLFGMFLDAYAMVHTVFESSDTASTNDRE